MKTKFFLLLIVLVLGSLLAACGPSTINVQPQPIQRTMVVTGMGTITLTPDIAYVYIGVHSQNETASVAVTKNTADSQQVIDALKKLGVEAKDIKTTNFSVYPSQQYDDKGQITGVIYMVDNTVYVTVRKLDKLGNLLDAAIQAGANNINSIQFDVADKTEALSQARLAAVEDAQKQAQELSSASGAKLGDIQTISYYDTTPVAYAVGKGGGGAADAVANVPVSAGQMQIVTTVTIVYGLK